MLYLTKSFEEYGPQHIPTRSSSSISRPRQPTWSPYGLTRLFHVLADGRHFISLSKLHESQKPETHLELDQPRHDPWGNEFQDVFNDNNFLPDVPGTVDGVNNDLLSSFNALFNPHMRTGDALQSKWTVLRSRLTVSTINFEKPGQG